MKGVENLLIPFLRQIKFFSQRDIEEKDYMTFIEQMTHSYMPKGQIVFEEGTVGEEFFIILRGEVGIYINVPKDSQGIGFVPSFYFRKSTWWHLFDKAKRT